MTDSPGLQTRLNHHPYQAPVEFSAVPVGVHKASTVFFPSVAAMRSRDWKDKSAYTYGLHGTPTTFVLEERLAELEGGRYAVLAPSGLSALALVDQSFLAQGDELVLPDNVYGPHRDLALRTLRAWGIGVQLYDATDPHSLAAVIGPRTRLVWFEAPGSVTLEFPDLPALVSVVQTANAGRDPGRRILTALDNTWGAGVAFCGFDLGVDVVMQALTKYPSGGADVLMGSVVSRDLSLHQQILLTHMRLGLGVGANDAELVLRGLSSLQLRYAAQDAATRELARWMQGRPEVARVFHPALAGSPGHEAWQRDARAAGCLFTVAFHERWSSSQIDDLCNRLRYFRLGYSWAGPVSLCVPYEMASMRSADFPYPRLVRFAVGLEAVDDLRRDLLQAMQAALTA